MNNIKTKLAEIKAYCEGATEGPWRADIWRSSINEPRLTTSKIILGDGVIGFGSISSGERAALDAEFIAQSRTLLPQLIKCVEVLDAGLKCNETFHRLGGIDDCEPCKARKQAEEILGGDNDRGE